MFVENSKRIGVVFVGKNESFELSCESRDTNHSLKMKLFSRPDELITSPSSSASFSE